MTDLLRCIRKCSDAFCVSGDQGYELAENAMVDLIRISWNTLVPEMERIAGTMEEKLLIMKKVAPLSMRTLPIATA